ncbi:MAG: DUF2605 domain-containing protein [Leptolyngbyaceae cyanobacterium CAN_BIN12]|nr:DUF2605 domain-containing protein [Leptolyngbyaceae cyanobacterium CAN_BIN12]
MSPSNSSESELLKSLLEPLLEDFQYWFERSRAFLETTEVLFLNSEQQADLLARVAQAQSEVSAAQSLFRAIGGQAGIETSVLAPWHQLISECWQVFHRHRLAESPNSVQIESQE